MCRKTIYYNTYADGSEDVTERVDTCRPGKMCARPERRECHRQLRFAKVHTSSPLPGTPGSLTDRRPSPYSADFLELPPTPRSKSPSPSRKHESGVYINGEKVASIGSRKDNKRSSPRTTPIVVHAPEPPSPRPAAMLKRHSTLPADYVVIENEAGRGRGGRPSRSTRRSSSRDAAATLRIPDDVSRASISPSRRSASPRPVHYREHTRTPRGYDFVDERRRTKSRRTSLYSDSAAAAYMTPPPQQPAARKEVHFTTADPVRDSIRQQNERIARRPKVYQEVKGILKKDLSNLSNMAVAGDGYDELRRAVGQMDIHPPTRQTGDEAQYWDRLRDRFEEPRERRRKSRVYYPGEGVYKYM